MSNSIYFLSLSRVFFFFCLPLYNYLLYRFTKSQIQNLYINFKYSSFSPSLLLSLLGILIASCARGLVGVNSYEDCTRSCRRASVRNRPSVREEREREEEATDRRWGCRGGAARRGGWSRRCRSRLPSPPPRCSSSSSSPPTPSSLRRPPPRRPPAPSLPPSWYGRRRLSFWPVPPRRSSTLTSLACSSRIRWRYGGMPPARSMFSVSRCVFLLLYLL